MRIRGWQGAVPFILLVLACASIRPSAFVWADPPPEHLSFRVPSFSENVPTQADFDDDRVEDPLTFTTNGGHPDVEIYLSHTQTVLVLSIDAVSAVTGSLTVRDLDRDGDEDLLWQGAQALAPAEVIVWLNDGTGHFARVLPPGVVPSQPTPGPSLGADSHHVRASQLCTLQRNPTPLGAPSFAWAQNSVVQARRDASAARPVVSFFQRFPCGRAPPTHTS